MTVSLKTNKNYINFATHYHPTDEVFYNIVSLFDGKSNRDTNEEGEDSLKKMERDKKKRSSKGNGVKSSRCAD